MICNELYEYVWYDWIRINYKMDDKKNENEKVMKYINTKLKDGEIPLMLQDILTYNKSNTEENKLIITSSSLFVIEKMSVKRYFKAAHI